MRVILDRYAQNEDSTLTTLIFYNKGIFYLEIKNNYTKNIRKFLREI